MAYTGFFNWDWVDLDQPQVLLSDLGLLRGYGIFEFFNVLEGRPLFLEDHLDRFFHSAGLLNMEVPMTRAELKQVIRELLRKNGETDAALRMLLTGGYSENAYRPGKPNLAILQQAYSELPPESYDEGVALITTGFKRELPEIKTTNYLNGIRLLPRLQAENAFEPLYHDHGYVRETVRSNIFLVNAAGALVTPDKRILMGITRKHVLELAREFLEVETRAVRLKELAEAREVFITGTYKRVLPVVRIDGQAIGAGKPGEVTRRLMAAFSDRRFAQPRLAEKQAVSSK